MTNQAFHKSLRPATLVIFGITGDLARRKLLPALYHLTRSGAIPPHLRIVGVTRRGITTKELLGSIRASIEKTDKTCDQTVLDKLGSQIEVITMDLLSLADYTRLRHRLNAIEDEAGLCMNRLYYLAIPAQTFRPLVERLGKAGLHKSCPHGTGSARLLIEKPFGFDLASAKELIRELEADFTEEQIYRIDHYLAKETAQNILNFRFQNPILKAIWNNQCISRITIAAVEAMGIEGRADFYDQTGALRDVVQSHLLQLLALVAMDEPKRLNATEIHRRKLALLKQIVPIAPNKVAKQAVRGQYKGYLEAVGKRSSLTETYAALQLAIDSDRWRGVPVVLCTGKALAKNFVEITVVFADDSKVTHDNVLTIRIQPNEGISLRLLAKKPGFNNAVEPVDMDFDYRRSFPAHNHPDAYERVLLDALRGDKTLFATSGEVLISWKIVENVIHEWAKNDAGLHMYEPGSWGPSAAVSAEWYITNKI